MTSQPAGSAHGASVAADPDLDLRVETPVPRTLPPGSATAVFVLGTLFHRRERVRRLELLVDGEPVEATAHSMPRIDLYQRLNPPSAWGDPAGAPGSAADPNLHSYRSGFWATVPVRMPASGAAAIEVRAELAGGGEARAPLATIAAAAEPPPIDPHSIPSASLAICMATWEPDPELLGVQLESIRGQSFGDWVCLISDDCSRPESLAAIEREIGGDPRFVLSRSERRIGFYRNFERALRMVPPGTEHVALSDQDDRWHPDKLDSLRAGLGDAQLVYSDQRLVDREGNVLAGSFWGGPRANNHANLASLLIANTVTGAASLFRRELLELALPFPETPGEQYHDHWLALVAGASGRIAYVDRPLYDYVQHTGATLGHEGANLPRGGNPTQGRLARAGAGSRISYFYAHCRLRVLAETLLLRAGESMRAGDRRALARYAASEGSPAGFAWLAGRRLRRLTGRTETLDAERIILIGILWRRAIALLGALRARPVPGLTYDAELPAGDGPSGTGLTEGIDHPPTRILGELIEPLRLSVSASAPERVNLLVPTIELQHLFGGYIAKFNLARKLSEAGLRVRILTVDPTPPLPADWRDRVEGYAGLSGLFERVEVGFARDRDAPVEVNPGDAFVATTWWTAHLAAAALAGVDRSRFLYLIQEFEPFTHPMGSWAAAALSTYELPHVALFSTSLLRDFFAARGYGVFAAGAEAGTRDSVAFANAITAVSPPSVEDLAARERKRLLFYARPESHGARNMFELGLLGLAEAVRRGAFGSEWDFHGIGSVEGRDRRISLPDGRELELLSKRDQGSYAGVLAAHDVGLALMCTPHPSLVPLEMASAGMLTVTNSYETKTAAAMRSISPNLIAPPPSLAGIVAGLEEAVAGVGEHERRVAGAAVDWPRDWEESFGPAVMERVVALVRAT